MCLWPSGGYDAVGCCYTHIDGKKDRLIEKEKETDEEYCSFHNYKKASLATSKKGIKTTIKANLEI